MWISTRAQYGLRALIEIGRAKEALSLKTVSKRQDISLHYLEQLAASLRRAGFIRAQRGAKGGYLMARDPAQITAYEVVMAMEGSLAPVICVEEGHECGSAGVCGTQNLWFRVDKAIKDVLGESTVADLIREAEATEHAQLIQLEDFSESSASKP